MIMKNAYLTLFCGLAFLSLSACEKLAIHDLDMKLPGGYGQKLDRPVAPHQDPKTPNAEDLRKDFRESPRGYQHDSNQKN